MHERLRRVGRSLCRIALIVIAILHADNAGQEAIAIACYFGGLGTLVLAFRPLKELQIL